MLALRTHMQRAPLRALLQLAVLSTALLPAWSSYVTGPRYISLSFRDVDDVPMPTSDQLIANTLKQLASGELAPRPYRNSTASSQGPSGRRLKDAPPKREYSIGWIPPKADRSFGTDPALAAYIADEVLGAVDAVLSRSIRVRNPPPDPLVEQVQYAFLDRNGGFQTLPRQRDQDELQRWDIILQVDLATPSDEVCQGSTLAAATPFFFEQPTYRPVFGLIFVCPLDVQGDSAVDFEILLEALVHEALHTMGFFPPLFPFFQGKGDQGRVLVTTPDATFIATSQVQKWVRSHFNCSSMIGAALEDSGGTGTAGGHWENRLYHGVLMQGSVKNDGHVNRIVLTDLTLALLQDSGWYDVLYNSVGFDPYGFNSGCALATGTYDEAAADPQSSLYVCQRDEECTPQTAFGMCNSADESVQLQCMLDALTKCAQCTSDYSGSGLCYNFFGPDNEDLLKVEKLIALGSLDCQATPGSRCHRDDVNATCVNMSCSDFGEVLINGELCSGPNCPDSELMCNSPGLLTCNNEVLNDCSGHGDCFQGACYCHIGFGGADCSVEVCHNSCDDGSQCPPSGFCGVETCGEFTTGPDDEGMPCHATDSSMLQVAR